MPRVNETPLDAKQAVGIISYDRYSINPSAPEYVRDALRTAPPGFAYMEEQNATQAARGIVSYQIHDTVRIP